ncbi:hypothetical protein [Knoellia flava]|nr:hypothetical protein [Knoellia flava]
MPFLHLLGFLSWSWVLIKVFVGDVDRWLFGAVAPSWAWVLDFRLLGFLLLAAVLVTVIRRKSWWMPVFVLLWPLLMLVFFLPKALYRRKNPTLAVGVIHAVSGFFRSLRFTLIALSITALAVIGILASETRWVLVVCAVALFSLWVFSLVKTLRFAISPGRFIASQRSLFTRLFNSDVVWRFVHLDENLKNPAIQKYDQQQANAIVTSLSTGLVCSRGAQFAASHLEAYRRSPASILSSCFAVFGLFLMGLFTFTFVNMAVYKSAPQEFLAGYEPSLATFAYYTSSSASFGEISALIPKGSLATAVNLLTGVGSGVIICMLIASVVLGFRQTREDEAATKQIEAMRREADEFEDRLAREYGLGPDELVRRLEELGVGFVKLIPFLFVRRPSSSQGRDGSTRA